jgi:hypothetical protein
LRRNLTARLRAAATATDPASLSNALGTVIGAIAPRLTAARALLASYGIPCLVDAAPSRVLSWLSADDNRCSLVGVIEEVLGPMPVREEDEAEPDELLDDMSPPKRLGRPVRDEGPWVPDGGGVDRPC